MTAPRVLVTGGCGFLGHHIVEHLLRNTNCEIVILDKLTYASNGFDRLRDVAAYDDARVKIICCDLNQPIPPGVDYEVGHVDFVIHAAAETHVDNSIVDPLPFYQANVIGTHHLLWWLRTRTQLLRIFLISTDEVYGPAEFGDDAEFFNEEARFRPANPYAAAKAGGEAIGMAYANTYKLPITIVNTMNLIGERQHFEKFVPKVIRAALTGNAISIHADATRTKSGTRFYIHCRNFADALLFMIRETWSNKPLPIKIHVAGEKEISNLDLAQLIAAVVGKPLVYELVDFHSSRPGHDLRYAMSATLIRERGWVQPKNIEESLTKTVQWFLANPRWLGQ